MATKRQVRYLTITLGFTLRNNLEFPVPCQVNMQWREDRQGRQLFGSIAITVKIAANKFEILLSMYSVDVVDALKGGGGVILKNG